MSEELMDNGTDINNDSQTILKEILGNPNVWSRLNAELSDDVLCTVGRDIHNQTL